MIHIMINENIYTTRLNIDINDSNVTILNSAYFIQIQHWQIPDKIIHCNRTTNINQANYIFKIILMTDITYKIL